MTEPVILEGKLDLSAVGGLHARLLAIAGQDTTLDFGAVTQIGALCLQTCLAAARRAQAAQVTFSMVNLSDALRDQMAVMGFTPETLAEGGA